jgi:hypothetical protein
MKVEGRRKTGNTILWLVYSLLFVAALVLWPEFRFMIVGMTLMSMALIAGTFIPLTIAELIFRLLYGKKFIWEFLHDPLGCDSE